MSNESSLIVTQKGFLHVNAVTSFNFLDNVAREPLELREIRVDVKKNRAYSDVPETFDAEKLFGFASLVDFGVRLQSTYLTVPRQVPLELLRSPFFDSLAEAEETTEFTFIPQRSVIWTFPEPLYVPAGAKIYAEAVFNAADGANASVVTTSDELARWLEMTVSLIFNRAPNKPKPQKSKIPYATTYRTPKLAFGASGNVQTFQAQDFQLKNHCRERIVVQRLTAWNAGDALVPTLLRYSDSTGKMINRDLTPLLELHANGALNLNTILEPNEFIAVEGEIDSRPIRQNLVDGSPSPIAETYEQQVLLGLVGYREVDTDVLWSDTLRNPRDGEAINPNAPPVLPHAVDLPPINPRLPGLPLPRAPFPPRGPFLPRKK